MQSTNDALSFKLFRCPEGNLQVVERERHFCTVLLVGSGARNMSMRNADGSSDLGTTTFWLRRPMTSIMTRDCAVNNAVGKKFFLDAQDSTSV